MKDLNQILEDSLTENDKISLERLREGQSIKAPEFKIFQAQNEKQQAYIDKVNGKTQKPLNAYDEALRRMEKILSKYDKPLIKPDIDFAQAKFIFGNCYKTIINKANKKFILDGNIEEIVPDLIKYMINDESSAYDLNKGLYIYGKVGTGKTTLLEILKDFAQCINFKQFKIANMFSIAHNLKITKSYEGLTIYNSGLWAYDDLGSDNEISIYGNSDELSKYVIFNWYENQHKDGLKLFATGNEMPSTIFDRYPDERFSDRFKELFNFILLSGKSKR